MVDNSKKDLDVRSELAVRSYKERLKVLRKGQEFSQADDIPRSVECYSQYLNALAGYFKVEEPKLDPKLFDQETEITEMLLISHVYWDLAKAYDRSPNLSLESIRCLDQFVKFSSGYKYQYVNARMLKNFIKKKLAHNPKAFKQTYERIQVESKGCYVSSHCFGKHSWQTNSLRRLKATLMTFTTGENFVDWYYLKYPNLIDFFEKHKILKRFFLKPFLNCVATSIKLFGRNRNVHN